jgi:dienelactone hydrolase
MKTKTQLLWAGLVLGLIHGAWAQPVITNQPQNQCSAAGTTAIFIVGATGAEPLSYQWRSYANTTTFTNIPFGTEATLVLTNVQPTTRRFAVVVTNVGGSVTSSPLVTLTVLGITSQPTDQIVDVGATATFTVAATGTAPLAYQWRFNDANLAGRTGTSLVLANAQSANAGNYTVIVTNACGSVTSRVAVLTCTTLHRIEGITANPAHTISLNLAGVVPRPFTNYYDIYPLEASTNLVDWSPLAMLQRTNNSADALSYLDHEATSIDKRFYRTPTNFLITAFPKPTGPYPVGTVSRLLTDPSRTNRYNIPTNSSFMVTFWYPAEARAGVLPVAYGEKEVIPISPDMVAQFVSHAFPGLPVATNQTSYPVVIYSHSLTTGLFRRQNSDKSEELASHGYVVVAVDHMNAATSVFPNGQVVHGTPPADRCDRAAIQTLLDNAIKDIQFVLDELNTNDTLLAGRMDLERLGAFGYSWGCVPVAEFCRIDPRCKAVVLFDGGRLLQMPPDLNQLGLQKPFLSMNSTGGWTPPCPNECPWLCASTNLFAKAANDAFWFQIQDSLHNNFDELVGLIYGPTLTFEGGPTPGSRAINQTLKACTLSFFDKYLKNQDDHLLDNPAAVYPNIINFQRK